MMAKQILASVLVFAMVISSASFQSCEYPPCSTVPQDILYFYPNWNDCTTHWQCLNGKATKLLCPDEQVFDFYTFRCARRPTRDTVDVAPVFSCEILLQGLSALDGPQQATRV